MMFVKMERENERNEELKERGRTERRKGSLKVEGKRK